MPATTIVWRGSTLPAWLEVDESPQRYEPLGGGVVRFVSGSFVADLRFDADGFVNRYGGLAERLA